MSNASRIREWLATQDGARNAAELRAGTGMTRNQVNAAVHDMVIAGILIRSGTPYVYALGRQPAARVPVPPGELKARINARKRKWYKTSAYRDRRNALRNPEAEARKAERKAAAEQRKQEREAAKAERKRQADARKAAQATRQQRKAKKQTQVLAKLAKSTEARSAKAAKPVAPVPGSLNAAKQKPAMTSDDFIRQGGKVERIAAGVVSEAGRLKRIGGEGHRALNRQSWARRAIA